MGQTNGTKRDNNVLFYSFLVCVAAIYYSTMFPSLSGGDSGELLSSVCNRNVPHPPGYPLWILLGILWNDALKWLGAGQSVAFRLNLMSIPLGIGAAFFLKLATEKITLRVVERLHRFAQEAAAESSAGGERIQDEDQGLSSLAFWCSLLGSGLYAFFPGIWEFSIQAEVFALNNFLVCFLLERFVSFTLDEVPSPKKAYMIAVISGLALSNQHTSILFVLPFALFTMIYGRRTLFKPRTLVLLSLCALVGLSPYAYLPIIAQSKRLDSWGDQSNFLGFMKHFLRKEYGTFKLANDLGQEQDVDKIMHRNSLFFLKFQLGTMNLGMQLLVSGICSLLTLSPKIGFPLILTYALYIGVMNTLSNLSFSDLHVSIQSRMWLQAHAISFLAVGVGAGFVIFKITHPRIRHYVAPFLVPLLLSVQIWRTYDKMDRSSTFIFDFYAQDLLLPLPNESILLVNDDLNCNVIQYFLRCERMKPGVQLIRLPLITYPWFNTMQAHHFPDVVFPGTVHHPFQLSEGSYNMHMFLQANIHKLPLYIAGPFKEGDDSHASWKRVPSGLADQLLPPGSQVNITDFTTALAKSWKHMPDLSAVQDTGSWEAVARVKYLEFFTRSTQLIAEALAPHLSSIEAIEAHKKTLRLARKIYRHMLNSSTPFDPESPFFVDPQVWKNAGVICGQLSRSKGMGNKTVEDMFSFWQTFLKVMKILKPEDTEDEDVQELSGILKDEINPYTGKQHAIKL